MAKFLCTSLATPSVERLLPCFTLDSGRVMILMMCVMCAIVIPMGVLVLVIRILQWDTQGPTAVELLTDSSDSCIPYNNTQTLWRVINDMDMVARVPFTPCTLFNGGAGDENHLLMTKGVIKVFPDC
jgi:hypothetical protein